MRGIPDPTLAARLRELKTHCGISCRQLGEALGCSTAAASRYLTGAVHIPADRLPQLAQAFGCEIGDLFMPVGRKCRSRFGKLPITAPAYGDWKRTRGSLIL